VLSSILKKSLAEWIFVFTASAVMGSITVSSAVAADPTPTGIDGVLRDLSPLSTAVYPVSIVFAPGTWGNPDSCKGKQAVPNGPNLGSLSVGSKTYVLFDLCTADGGGYTSFILQASSYYDDGTDKVIVLTLDIPGRFSHSLAHLTGEVSTGSLGGDFAARFN